MITMPVPLAMALAALPTSSFTVSTGARASNFTAMHRRARSRGLRREPAGLVQWAQYFGHLNIQRNILLKCLDRVCFQTFTGR